MFMGSAYHIILSEKAQYKIELANSPLWKSMQGKKLERNKLNK